MLTAPYGTWPSPIAPEDGASGQVSIDEVRVDREDTWWIETRPWEGGRAALVRHDGAETIDVLPRPWNVRSRVHEYGGGAYAVHNGTLVFSEFTDGRLRRLDPGAAGPVAITPEITVRYGGLVLRGSHVFAVREDHRGDGEPRNELVRLDLHGDNPDGGLLLCGDSDFVSRPTVSPDGRWLAWVSWDHPNMPWESTRLRLAHLTDSGVGPATVIAGGEGIAVCQPQFGPDGTLWFIDDSTGWWNLYRYDGRGCHATCPIDADLTQPQWMLGIVDHAVLPGGRVLTRRWEGDRSRLGILDAATGELTDVADDGVTFEHLVAVGDDIAYVRGLVDRAPEVVRGPWNGPRRVVATSSSTRPDPGFVSRAEARSWSNTEGQTTHGLFCAPKNPTVQAPEDELPPLLVFVHGGPTKRAEPAYSDALQFWTTRGFAVLDVNYGGSSGYGRAYRQRLVGQWGVADVDDCLTGALAMAEEGVVDGGRMAIRGGSAGGYAVLRALTTSTVFAAGTSYFGISDLTALVADDQKFESRYTMTLIAPWPERADVYAERSPVHHVDRLHGNLLLFQGTDDLVVPLAQARLMADAMRAAGRDVELVEYEGEGHFFRRADTIVDTMTRELAHYRRAFRLGPTSERG